MAIGQVVTGGLGNSTLTTTIPLVLLRGLIPATPVVVPGIEGSQPGTRLHARQPGTRLHASQPNGRIQATDIEPR